MKKILIILTILLIQINSAQTLTPDNIVEVKLIPKTKNIKPGSVIDVDLLLNIKEGWHINSNKPLDPNLIPTKIFLPDTSSMKIIKIEYPQPVFTNLSFSETELALYEHEAVIKMQVKINKKYKKDKLIFSGQVQYQPCNDQTCLFPFTKTFTSEIKISR